MSNGIRSGTAEQLLTSEEVAEWLRVSVLTVRWLRQERPLRSCDPGRPSSRLGCS